MESFRWPIHVMLAAGSIFLLVSIARSLRRNKNGRVCIELKLLVIPTILTLFASLYNVFRTILFWYMGGKPFVDAGLTETSATLVLASLLVFIVTSIFCVREGDRYG